MGSLEDGSFTGDPEGCKRKDGVMSMSAHRGPVGGYGRGLE
jgi:hypothetical protein